MIINGQSLLKACPIKDMLDYKARSNGVSHGLTEAGYDIRIKQDVKFEPNEQAPYLNCWTRVDDAIFAQPGRFTIASAIEEFDMPYNLTGEVKDKSTWARQGLSVFNTVIEAGWKGFLTLELVYHGNTPLHIPAGSGIAQVLFYEMSDPAIYSGKYQNQADEPVAAKFES